MRARINTEMQLAPPAARSDTMFLIQPFALAVNLEARAVDEKMQRFVTTDPAWQDRQPAAPPAQSRVIGDSDIDMEHRGDRAQQAFGLTQRLMKYQAQRETGLDGNLRIDRLTTAFSSRWGMPSRNRFFGEPNRDAAPSYQCGFVFRPVRDPVSGFRDLMAAAFIVLVRHGSSR